MAYKLEKLVELGLISSDACMNLQKRWVTDADEFYFQILDCVWGNKDLKPFLAKELGVEEKHLDIILNKIIPYVSEDRIMSLEEYNYFLENHNYSRGYIPHKKDPKI